jgi:hypothetical protein
MRKKVLLQSLFGVLATVSSAAVASAGDLSREQVKRFDANGDEFVDRDKAVVYARHIYDKHNILADYDSNVNGRIDPQELETLNADLASIDVTPESAEIRLRVEQNAPIPLEAGPASIEAVISENVSRAYLREKRIEIGIDTEEPGDAIASGAAITMTNDIEGHENIASITAAAGYLFRRNLSYPEGYIGGDLALTAISFGPYVEADGDVNSDESRVSIGAVAQAEVLGGPVFDLQRYSIAPYYQTDFKGESSVFGAALSWQPYILDLGLGSVRRIADGNLDFSWGLTLQADYRRVGDAGATGLSPDDDYAWLGGTASARFWPFPDFFESRVFADAQYSYFYDVVGGQSASLFSGGIGLAIDEAGNATLNVEYVKGRDYQTETDKNQVKTALKVKF